jgi:tetratricopeptide (TPR) repeat protein
MGRLIRGERFRAGLFVAVLAAAAFAAEQNGGRFEEAKRQANALLESGQYERAAGRFEEIWELDKSDATVVEGLAIAYLNGEERAEHPQALDKARDLLNRALSLGGRATFLVQHSHEKAAILQGRTVNNYCSGRLTVTPGRLVFVAQARKGVEEHSFDVTAADVHVTPTGNNDSQGEFQIKTKPRNYAMLPRTRLKADGILISAFLQENLVKK